MTDDFGKHEETSLLVSLIVLFALVLPLPTRLCFRGLNPPGPLYPGLRIHTSGAPLSQTACDTINRAQD